MNIPLVKDTIDNSDIEKLVDWLKEGHRLTKGNVTIEFEQKWSKYLGTKYSVYLNSGSSANLAMIYTLIQSGRLKNNNVIVPTVSWVTTVTPIMQLGLNPILCDCDVDNLGLDITHLKQLIIEHKPSVVMLVHVLGIPNHMNEIIEICKENEIILIEDSCESIGSKFNDIKTGAFGNMSSFSFYFGHHMSTIEGGMVSTNDDELYKILLSIRSHGWDRDLPEKEQKIIREKYNLTDFRSLYTFYYPGFNLRSTDLQAYIGVNQLDKIENIVIKRNKNFELYNKYIDDKFWKIIPPKNTYISNFAYPLILKNVDNMSKILFENGVENRPLICGSINEQPFWYERYGKTKLPNAEKVHNNGMYLPNNPDLTEDEIKYVSTLINKHGEKL